MNEENTLRFLAYYKEVEPEWLLTGNGAMLKVGVLFDEEIEKSFSELNYLREINVLLRDKIKLLEHNSSLLMREIEHLGGE